jgi:PKD repeat protein
MSTSFIAGREGGSNSTSSGPGPSCIPVNAAFSALPITGEAPLVVQFSDFSSGDPTTWSWNFGDGNTSSEKNPIHTFWTQGSYSVSLTASKNEPNCTSSDTQVFSIIVTPPSQECIPVIATFYGTPTSGLIPLNVQFTDTSTGSPTNWSWFFGDGDTSNLQNPNHTYNSVGNFTVSLTVSKNEPNCSSFDNLTVPRYIQVSCPQVIAAFTGEPRAGEIPLTVTFSDRSTGNPTSWFWSFGDGGTSNIQNPDHQYTSIGPFTVTLNASNNCGSSNVISYLNFISPSLSGTGDVINLTKMCGARGYLKGGTYYQFGDGSVESIIINGNTYTDLNKKVVKLEINGDQISGHLYMDHPICNDFSFNVKMYVDGILRDTGLVTAITAQVNKNSDDSTLTYVLDPSCISYTHLIINSKDIINQDNNSARMEISNMKIIHDNKDPYVNKFIINLDGSNNQINTQGDIVVY